MKGYVSQTTDRGVNSRQLIEAGRVQDGSAAYFLMFSGPSADIISATFSPFLLASVSINLL